VTGRPLPKAPPDSPYGGSGGAEAVPDSPQGGTVMTTRSVTDRLRGLAFGGATSPSSWDEPVWKEDDELMRDGEAYAVSHRPNPRNRTSW